jgi:hypothetical protein
MFYVDFWSNFFIEVSRKKTLKKETLFLITDRFIS